jgi:hypothetical protein
MAVKFDPILGKLRESDASSGAGSGDVVGPASAVDAQIAVFSGTTGKLIADGGATIASLGGLFTEDGSSNIIGGTGAGAYITGSNNFVAGVGAAGTVGATLGTGSNVVIGHGTVGLAAATGTSNIAIGQQAGEDLTSGAYNCLIGVTAGAALTGGANNIYVGFRAGRDGAGGNNVGIGYEALRTPGAATNSVAVGYLAGRLATGSDCVYIGDSAGYGVTGADNTILGANAADAATSMSGSVVIGKDAVGTGICVQPDNTIIGTGAGALLATGAGLNIFIGHDAGASQVTATGKLLIDNKSTTTSFIDGTMAAATVDQLLTVNGSFEPAENGFGNMYQKDNATVTTINTVNVWEKVENFSAGALRKCTFATNTLTTPAHAGSYKISATISSSAASANKIFEFAIYVEGVEAVGGIVRRKFSSTDVGTMAVTCVATLAASDTVELYVRNITDTTNHTIVHSSVSLFRI